MYSPNEDVLFSSLSLSRKLSQLVSGLRSLSPRNPLPSPTAFGVKGREEVELKNISVPDTAVINYLSYVVQFSYSKEVHTLNVLSLSKCPSSFLTSGNSSLVTFFPFSSINRQFEMLM